MEIIWNILARPPRASDENEKDKKKLESQLQGYLFETQTQWYFFELTYCK